MNSGIENRPQTYNEQTPHNPEDSQDNQERDDIDEIAQEIVESIFRGVHDVGVRLTSTVLKLQTDPVLAQRLKRAGIGVSALAASVGMMMAGAVTPTEVALVATTATAAAGSAALAGGAVYGAYKAVDAFIPEAADFAGKSMKGALRIPELAWRGLGRVQTEIGYLLLRGGNASRIVAGGVRELGLGAEELGKKPRELRERLQAKKNEKKLHREIVNLSARIDRLTEKIKQDAERNSIIGGRSHENARRMLVQQLEQKKDEMLKEFGYIQIYDIVDVVAVDLEAELDELNKPETFVQVGGLGNEGAALFQANQELAAELWGEIEPYGEPEEIVDEQVQQTGFDISKIPLPNYE